MEDSPSETPVPSISSPSSTHDLPATMPAVPSGGGRKSLTGHSSTESRNWEHRRSSRALKRSSVHSLGSRKFSSASSRSEGYESSKRDVGGGKAAASRDSGKGSSMRAESDDEEALRPEWALDQIELSDSDSDLEFFDAQGNLSFSSLPPLLYSKPHPLPPLFTPLLCSLPQAPFSNNFL